MGYSDLRSLKKIVISRLNIFCLLGMLTKIFAVKFTCLIETLAVGQLVLSSVLLVVIIIRSVMRRESSVSCNDAWSYQESVM